MVNFAGSVFLFRFRRLNQGPEHPNVKRMVSQAMWGILHQRHCASKCEPIARVTYFVEVMMEKRWVVTNNHYSGIHYWFGVENYESTH